MNKFLIGIVAASVGWTVQAEVKLNALFQDHMVIQRETLAPIWGWAEPGEKIFVNASWGAKAEGVTGLDGRWMVKLQTPEAGGPHSIHVSGSNTLELSDVLSGEVWLCSGQSNMECLMGMFCKDAREEKYQPAVEYIRNEVATAVDPMLRQIQVPKTASHFALEEDFNGAWIRSAPDSNAAFTATGYFFGRELRRKLGVPVGLVLSSWGGTRVQPWIPKVAYRSNPEMSEYYDKGMAEVRRNMERWSEEAAQHKYEADVAKWEANGSEGRKPRKTTHPEHDPKVPSTLYNGMINPVVPFAIRGVVWYQGETNRHHLPDSYAAYFRTLITSWRKAWGQGDFPFYYAQLANYGDSNAEPLEENGWATVCDQQRRALSVEHTGMAVLIDIGEAKDIHPHNKIDVGRRLALWALANDYGIEVPAVSGPLYKEYEIKDDKMLIRFSEVGSGLMVGHKHVLDPVQPVDGSLCCFQIAAEDRVWKWAQAKIVAKDTVEVSHPDISRPAMVRYAWSGNPEDANLYNKEGLPASVFTTE